MAEYKNFDREYFDDDSPTADFKYDENHQWYNPVNWGDEATTLIKTFIEMFHRTPRSFHDAACGKGYLVNAMDKKNIFMRCSGSDISEYAIGATPYPKLDLYVANLLDLKTQYDIVSVCGVMHYLTKEDNEKFYANCKNNNVGMIELGFTPWYDDEKCRKEWTSDYYKGYDFSFFDPYERIVMMLKYGYAIRHVRYITVNGVTDVSHVYFARI